MLSCRNCWYSQTSLKYIFCYCVKFDKLFVPLDTANLCEYYNERKFYKFVHK